MSNRRRFLAGMAFLPFTLRFGALWADDSMLAPAAVEEEEFADLEFPPFTALTDAKPFGYTAPSAAEQAKAREIIASMPKGPKPIDIAQAFVDRYYETDPATIAQWPKGKPWNPLVVEFFSATTTLVNNDMTPWCSAFANWCLKRAGQVGSNSAASQSFLRFPRVFVPTVDPKVGDLAIFTCFKVDTNDSVGLGHIGFVKEPPRDGKVLVLGGNQSADKSHSIISAVSMRTATRKVKRTIDGKKVLLDMRLNTYLTYA